MANVHAITAGNANALSLVIRFTVALDVIIGSIG
jgi:hypothetical protein